MWNRCGGWVDSWVGGWDLGCVDEVGGLAGGFAMDGWADLGVFDIWVS